MRFEPLVLFTVLVSSRDDCFLRSVSAQTTTTLPSVEYTFNNVSNPTQNTGNGVPSNTTLFASLDGIPLPASGNGISFVNASASLGRDGTTAATLTGNGCLYIPDSEDVNLPPDGVSDRTISLDFKWNGNTVVVNSTNALNNTNSSDAQYYYEPQVLFEEGSIARGINIYLTSFMMNYSYSTAQLVMAVWDKEQRQHESTVINSTLNAIEANKWYRTTLVLDRQDDYPMTNTTNGTLAGFLDGVPFDTPKAVHLMPVRKHFNDNCVGGMKGRTRIFPMDGDTEQEYSENGLYFHGHLDNFKLVNDVEIPDVLTPSPSMSPSWTPSSVPSKVPSLLPTTVPSSKPTTLPSMEPSLLPTRIPSSTPTTLPSMVPSSSPTRMPSSFPSKLPSTVPSSSPTRMPSSFPSKLPSMVPSSSPTAVLKGAMAKSSMSSKSSKGKGKGGGKGGSGMMRKQDNVFAS